MASQAAHNNDEGPELRSSLEIMGCLAPATHFTFTPGVAATLSRPSSMPDFDHVVMSDSPLPLEMEVESTSDNSRQEKAKRFLQVVISISFLLFSLLSITATGAIMTVLNQIGKPVSVGYIVWMAVSIAILVLSMAGLGHIFYDPTTVLFRFSPRPRLLNWTPRLPSFKWNVRLPKFHLRSLKKRFTARPRQRSSSHLPHPKEFELGDLESQQRRPPTPYPGPARPVPAVPPQRSLQQNRTQTLPLGFPMPPSGVNRMTSRASRMSSVSFRSDPRSVSPLSDAPPTPPPKEQTVSRFQSREPLLPPTASGQTIAQSDTRTSILTELCDAVQTSNPDVEPGTAVSHYTPLGTASSSNDIQSPKPTYPIELASPSRSRGRENEG